MKPSELNKHPFDSVTQNNECEVVARNIMVILSRTGDKFRSLGWEEYKEHRVKDGNFTNSEKQYFDRVVGYCVSEDTAKLFSPQWAA